MTDDQNKWLATKPEFDVWRPHGAVSFYGWTDVGYLTPDGRFIPDGTTHGWAYPTHLMSSGDTLYVVPKGSVKVGREYMIA